MLTHIPKHGEYAYVQSEPLTIDKWIVISGPKLVKVLGYDGPFIHESIKVIDLDGRIYYVSYAAFVDNASPAQAYKALRSKREFNELQEEIWKSGMVPHTVPIFRRADRDKRKRRKR